MTLRTAPLACTALVVAFTGCGSGDDSSGESPQKRSQGRDRAPLTPEEQVTRTVHTYYSAYVVGDGRTACSLLSPRTKPRLVREARRSDPELRKASCEKIVSESNELRNRSLAVRYAEVNGDKALAVAARRRIKLEKVGGEWKIAAFSKQAR